jgi:CheY-like chemotaxis protein
MKLRLAILFLAIASIPLHFVSAITFTHYRNSLDSARLSNLRDIAAFKADKIETQERDIAWKIGDLPDIVGLTLAGLSDSHLADEVVVARDDEEALNFLHRRGKFAGRTDGNPVVVLLELKLPKVGGLEVLRQLKADEALKMVPVVILTSSHEDRDMVEGYKLGTNAYVVKPVDFHQFVDAIRHIGAFWALINEPPPGSMQKRS